MWNENRNTALICLAFAIALRIFQHVHGQDAELNLFLEPFIILFLAFLLPAMMPLIVIERVWFHYAPWDDGHTATTIFYMVIAASCFWFFPTGRIKRWFGTFDAVSGAGKRRLPSLSRGMAATLDAMNRLKIGKGKMGGWA